MNAGVEYKGKKILVRYLGSIFVINLSLANSLEISDQSDSFFYPEEGGNASTGV